jgi:ABC-type branched-subunit amino acid transport system ATPase component
VDPGSTPATTPNGSGPPGSSAAVVEVRGLSKSFGGIQAVRDLSLDLERGKITALVGPNGAGKTTVFNLLTGAIRADAGTVLLGGEDITGRRPDAVARRGMVRSFQDVRVFGRLSVLQNVATAVQGQPGERLASLFVAPRKVAAGERRTKARAREWLGFVGLADLSDVPAGRLAFGQQKLLAIARVLAAEGDVLLLDEPASGIDGRWVDVTLELIGRLREAGKTICIVEHSLHVVEQLADVTYFMELGSVTARGRLSDLLREERLAEAYFGTI